MNLAEARPRAPWALVRDEARFLCFERPEAVIEARKADQVPEALRRVDAALEDGRWVAGYLAYEAAGAFGLETRPPDPEGPPLLWFGVFGVPESLEAAALDARVAAPGTSPGDWRPGLDEAAHRAALGRLQERIAAGDTYQVNFTFPLRATRGEDPWDLFSRLLASQRPPHAAFIDSGGRHAVVSASPELFFRLDGETLTTRPMKGTAPRGVTLAEDDRRAAELRGSEKNRAENLMIVDMLRNDLGRVADVGSVTVPTLFEIERYPTLLQMTSTVRARSRASLSAIVSALFPCASVTGAPKKRTMEIIAAEESGPRGVYTGALGWAGPERRACFSVAIRTVVADREDGSASYGVGSGVVADSVADDEYAECLLKARILGEPPFALLETLAFHPGEGYRRLDGHLARLRDSARYFGIPVEEARVVAELRQLAQGLRLPSRVRLLVDGFGRVSLESGALPAPGLSPARVALAPAPVSAGSVWLHHKTTRREVYDRARASRPDCDDVLLWNERGELTESTLANVVVERGEERVTPPVSCGLLAGVERAHLLAQGQIREAVVRIGDLRRGQRIWLANSVRGTYAAELVA